LFGALVKGSETGIYSHNLHTYVLDMFRNADHA